MTQPYMKEGLRTEDPFDGFWPPQHKSQKKGARQEAKKDLQNRLREEDKSAI